jgi:hypothetical protein
MFPMPWKQQSQKTDYEIDKNEVFNKFDSNVFIAIFIKEDRF